MEINTKPAARGWRCSSAAESGHTLSPRVISAMALQMFPHEPWMQLLRGPTAQVSSLPHWSPSITHLAVSFSSIAYRTAKPQERASGLHCETIIKQSYAPPGRVNLIIFPDIEVIWSLFHTQSSRLACAT